MPSAVVLEVVLIATSLAVVARSDETHAKVF